MTVATIGMERSYVGCVSEVEPIGIVSIYIYIDIICKGEEKRGIKDDSGSPM